MRRAFAFDVLACPRCGERLRLIALIEQAAVIERILGHLDLPTDLPQARPARAPPLAGAAHALLGSDPAAGRAHRNAGGQSVGTSRVSSSNQCCTMMICGAGAASPPSTSPVCTPTNRVPSGITS